MSFRVSKKTKTSKFKNKDPLDLLKTQKKRTKDDILNIERDITTLQEKLEKKQLELLKLQTVDESIDQRIENVILTNNGEFSDNSSALQDILNEKTKGTYTEPKYKFLPKLTSHMNNFKSDPWLNVFLYTFAFDPDSHGNINEFINSIPRINLCKDKEYVRNWINNNKNLIEIAIKDKHKFIDFMIFLRNVVHKSNGEPTLTKQEILDKYQISLS